MFVIILMILGIIESVPSCTVGKKFCSKCHQITNLCFTCERDVFVPDDEGGCIGSKKCSIGLNYCQSCNEEGTLCEVCSKGYFPDENGGCSLINNCGISYRGECLSCINGFILIGQSLCFKICKSLESEDFMNCKEIVYTTGLCIKCEDNYYLNVGDGKCIETNNCYESSYGQCTSCNMGYYLDNNDGKQCKENTKELAFYHCKESDDSEKCSKCENNYYMAGNGVCTLANFCETAKYNCEKCIDGYYLSGNTDSCTNTENCDRGDKDTGFCERCKSDYYIDYDDGQCKSNQQDDDLKYCTVFNGKCKSCINNYYLGEDNKCSDTQYCSSSEFGICQKCSDGYNLGVDNKCTNIEHCIKSNAPFSCIECEDGYYLPDGRQECLVAEGIFENCKISDYSLTYCEICKDDYYILPSDNLCYSNKEEGPFYKCKTASTDGKRCWGCITGYYLGSIDNKCSPIANCAKSEEGKCLECEEYYCFIVKNGTCEYNGYIINEENKFLFNCLKTNKEGTACEICVGNYTLSDSGLCTGEYYCEEENDGECVKCTTVEEDYSIFCLNKEFVCVESYFLQNCLRCDDINDTDYCTECLEGFHTNNFGQCIED